MKNKNIILNRTLASALVLVQAIPARAVTRLDHVTDASREEIAAFKNEVRDDGKLLNKLILNFTKQWDKILSQRGQPNGPDENSDMTTLSDYDKVYVRPPSKEEIQTARDTKDLANKYYSPQGINRYLGSFIESGAPYSDGYQWNTHRWQGLLIPKIRNKMLDLAQKNGISNIRFGVNTQDIDLRKPETAQQVVDMCVEMWKRGITPTIAIFFFPSLKNLRTFDTNGNLIPEKSYQNHPDFPKYAEQLSRLVLGEVHKAQVKFNQENSLLPKNQQVARARYSINEVNEPETDVGFNHFWRDALAHWSDPNAMRLYVPGIINTAKAKVRIRIASEEVAHGEEILYFHNEAMTPPDYPSHKGDGQFAISKFMLGDDMLMNANINQLRTESIDSIQQRFDANKAKGVTNVVDWSILAYVNVPKNDSAEKREQARQFILGQLEELQNMHHELKAKTGLTAKSRTMLMLDYYQQTEFQFNRSTSQLVEDLVKDNGALLRKVLKVKDDAGIMQVFHERVGQAEDLTGQPLRQLLTGTSENELRKILTVEDGVMLDKVIGFRNGWHTDQDKLFVDRRAMLGLKDPELNELAADDKMRDERRIDPLLTKLLENDNALLKQVLGVDSDLNLRQTLSQYAQFNDSNSIRDILNLNDRKALNDIFGLKKQRKLGMLPPHFARQSRLNLRNGVYKSVIKYINELGVRVGGIGETGTPYVPWAENWHMQAFMETVAAFRKSGAFFMRYDLGALVGAVGWIRGPLIKSIKENSERALDGVFQLVYKGKKGEKASADHYDFELGRFMDKEPWFAIFRRNLMGYISEAQTDLAKENARVRAEKEKAVGSCRDIFKAS